MLKQILINIVRKKKNKIKLIKKYFKNLINIEKTNISFLKKKSLKNKDNKKILTIGV